MVLNKKSPLYKEYIKAIKDDSELRGITKRIKDNYKIKLKNDSKRIFEEKFKLEYCIDSIVKSDLVTFVGVLASVIISVLVLFFSLVYGNKLILDINFLKTICIRIIIIFTFYVTIVSLFNEFINRRKNTQKYFYILCLKTINDIEEEMAKKYNDTKQEVAVTKDIKRKVARRVKKKVIYYY